MKLAIFVDQFPSLSQSFVTNQVVGLLNLGVEVTVISVTDVGAQANLLQYFEPKKLDVIYLLKEQGLSKRHKFIQRLLSLVKSLVLNKQCKRIFSALNWRYGYHAKSLLLPSIVGNIKTPLVFDAILCHFGFNGVLANKLRNLGVIEGKIATIFHGHDISAQSSLLQYGNEYKQLFKQTELMLPISDKWQYKLIDLGCSAEKILVHRMGVDLTIFKPRTPEPRTPEPSTPEPSTLEPSTFTLFTVARFSEKKGLKYAIQALALLPEYINFHYYLAGFGEQEAELKALVSSLNLTVKVTFLGALKQPQVTQWMLKADVFMQPSITADNGDMEGVPVAIMEAMAMKVSVVSTYHSGIPELITHNIHGLLAAEKDSQALAENITLLYNNRDLVEQLTNNARCQIEQMADVNKLNQKLVKILHNI